MCRARHHDVRCRGRGCVLWFVVCCVRCGWWLCYLHGFAWHIILGIMPNIMRRGLFTTLCARVFAN
jgi:hypothetical protein